MYPVFMNYVHLPPVVLHTVKMQVIMMFGAPTWTDKITDAIANMTITAMAQTGSTSVAVLGVSEWGYVSLRLTL